jgi:hypothetical protein
MADDSITSREVEPDKTLPNNGGTSVRVMPRSPIERPLVDERVSAEETAVMRNKGRPSGGAKE